MDRGILCPFYLAMHHMPLILGLTGGMKSNLGDSYVRTLLFWIPFLIYSNGHYATLAIVLALSSFWGPLALNFIAATDERIHRLCPISPINVFPVSARSSFPSMIPILQAFNMCFIAFYIGYRMNTGESWCSIKRCFKYLIQLGAFALMLITGFVTIHRNEADHLVMWTSCWYGMCMALLTKLALGWLERRIRKKLKARHDPFGILNEQDDAALQNNHPSTIIPYWWQTQTDSAFMTDYGLIEYTMWRTNCISL